MSESRKNPFGIAEDEECFDELIAAEASSVVGEINITKALAWLEQWQKENPERHIHRLPEWSPENICPDCGQSICEAIARGGVGCTLTRDHNGLHQNEWTKATWSDE